VQLDLLARRNSRLQPIEDRVEARIRVAGLVAAGPTILGTGNVPAM